MVNPNKDEINKIAKEFVELRERAEKSKSKKIKSKFEEFQEIVVKKLSHLVLLRTNRYRMFNNHHDLQQDGFEALFMALKTYRPEKGDFSWWAKKYIDTRVSRSANAHSTIKYPLKTIKDFKPHKMSAIPVITDTAFTPQENLEYSELKNTIAEAINLLPEIQQRVVKLSFEMAGNRASTITKISEELKISRTQTIKILESAKEQLKITLANNLKDMENNE
jgi:RNA polymerase sigma factor (sigma-70 family)